MGVKTRLDTVSSATGCRGAMWAGVLFAAAMALAPAARAAGEAPALIDAAKPQGGWTFDNGREFPGATGSLELAPSGGHDGGPALVLHGDFSGGGNYVQASRVLDTPLQLNSLSFWIQQPGASLVSLRLMDAEGTCHQLKLKLQSQDGWQRVQFPAADFFANMGEGRAAERVAKYEHWGKTKNAGWQGGLHSIHILIGKPAGTAQTLQLSDMVISSTGASVAAQPTAMVTRAVALDEVLQAGEVDWTFDNGREFKGATGALTLLKDQPTAGQNALRLTGDFTGGGAYVQATRKLPELGDGTLESLVLTMRSTNCSTFNIRLIDSTGQCHQHKGLTLPTDGAWHDVVLKPAQIAGGEHWGGANDGQWHGSATLIALLISKGQAMQPIMDFGRARARLAVTTTLSQAAYREGFESGALPANWETAGAVAITSVQPFAGQGALQLTRSLDAINQPTSARGPAFAAHPGTWQVAGAGRSGLYSPDSSYQGVIAVEWSDGTGHTLGRAVALELRGTNVWQPFSKTFDAPAGTVSGRVTAALEKTYGTLAADELAVSCAPASAGSSAKRIDRVMAMPAQLGGIFLPGETPTYKLSVWAPKPLRPEELTLTVTVSDYWGAEQGPGQAVTLTKTAFKNQVFQYEGELKLAQPLQSGKFYRLHLDVPLQGAKPFRHTIGLAQLPEAPTRKLPPEAVPFTIRNWDNRMKDYFFLTDRIGIRTPGIWGGWDNKAPYKAHAPGVEWCKQLGMKWVSGLPGAQVERGNADWADPVMLREGMTNFLKAYATNGLAYLCLGNEPHGGSIQIASNIAAYKVMYEAVKAFDPSIKVIATSVEPNEEYFRQGYQNFCDIYDFHTYESYTGVRTTIDAYKALMNKYHAEKPIYSTELGLNCQGLSRMIVAQEMVKKFAVFFAAGGANASWFTIMYPDSKGTEANSSGQAFNIYDARYNAFNPKLDAVTLYHAVNSIGDKTFRAERQQADGTQTYLFANPAGDCLLIAWNDKRRVDLGLSLPGIEANATAVLLDGSTLALTPQDGAITVTVSADPLLIQYHAAHPLLAEATVAAALSTSADAATTVVQGRSRMVSVHGPGLTAAALRVAAPPRWQTACSDAGADTVAVAITAPAGSDAQLGRLLLSRVAGAAPVGTIVVDLPVVSSFDAALRPLPAAAPGTGGVAITLANHGTEPVTLRWQATLDGAFPIAKGSFRLTDPQPAKAGFGEAAEGTVSLAAGGAQLVRLSLRDVDPQTIYRMTLRATDEGGHESTVSRLLAGFAAVKRGTPTVDGDLTDACWAAAPALAINEERQFFGFKGSGAWRGTNDLSAVIRYLWDTHNLYIGVHVMDDVFVGTKCDNSLWNQDGLQLLVDPRRAGGEKMGYYDISMGLGTKGPQVCFHSTASPEVPTGLAPDVKLAVTRGPNGNADYEVAIPWSRLAPIQPVAGADLGLCLLVNDDDGNGRNFAGWFSGAHLKETDMVGDLILAE